MEEYALYAWSRALRPPKITVDAKLSTAKYEKDTQMLQLRFLIVANVENRPIKDFELARDLGGMPQQAMFPFLYKI